MRGRPWAMCLTLLFVGGVSGVPLLHAELAGTDTPRASAILEVKKLKVNGITCFGCVQAVQSALEQVPGVTHAEVSLDTSEALVEYDPGQTDPEALVAAVTDSGFEAAPKAPDPSAPAEQR